MKKAILHEITALANKLPIQTKVQRITERFTQQEIAEAAERFGAPVPKVNGTKAVTTTKIATVNHIQLMKLAYKAGGMPAVQEYYNKNAVPLAGTEEASGV